MTPIGASGRCSFCAYRTHKVTLLRPLRHPRSQSSARTYRARAASRTEPEISQLPKTDVDVYIGTIDHGIKAEDIEKSFKRHEVLKGVSMQAGHKERVGLVGFNGSGKTTLMRIISGTMRPDGGTIERAKGSVGQLLQEFDIDENLTVREELMKSFGNLSKLREKVEIVQNEMETAPDEVLNDPDKMGALLDKLADAQENVTNAEKRYVDADERISKTILELGFESVEDGETKVSKLSGGWQMRLGIGKLLLEEPNILLLDEPTNHLDVFTVQWLEKYLKNQESPMVVVSHDREFLDQVCTKIVEIERGKSTSFKGAYSDYAIQKHKDFLIEKDKYEKQQNKMQELKRLIAKLRGNMGATGRIDNAKRELAKLKENEVEKPFKLRTKGIEFPVANLGPKVVASVNNLSHGYGDKVIFQNADLEIFRGQRLALVGPNGSGKTTLIRLLLGMEEPNKGTAKVHHATRANYFAQNQAEALDLDLTLLETLAYSAETATAANGQRIDVNDFKGLLGRLGFEHNMWEKKVGDLSGGEKARVALAKFICTPANVLFLDEITNHLDIPTKEVLEEALDSFQGTVIVASHDRYFMRRVCDSILDVRDSSLTSMYSDYSEYIKDNKPMRKAVTQREIALTKQDQKRQRSTSKMMRIERDDAKSRRKAEKERKRAGIRARKAKGNAAVLQKKINNEKKIGRGRKRRR